MIFKIFNSRKGIELQVNFIVMMIIAIVIFGLGLSIVMNSFSNANELKDTLDKQVENEILNYLNNGKVISMGINRKEIKHGDMNTFAIGMINKYGIDIEFYVKIDTSFIAVDNNNHLINIQDYNIYGLKNWTYPRRPVNNDKYYSLKDNEKKVIPLAFKVPGNAPKGLYAFTVEVMYRKKGTPDSFNLFNNQALKIYIEVP